MLSAARRLRPRIETGNREDACRLAGGSRNFYEKSLASDRGCSRKGTLSVSSSLNYSATAESICAAIITRVPNTFRGCLKVLEEMIIKGCIFVDSGEA